ncbi:MAG: hypothetical protein AB7L09_00085 [Nitrospira sp.]
MAELNGSLEDLAKDLGTKVFNQVKDDFGDAWDSVKDEVKDVLKEVTADAGRLAVKRIGGADTSVEEKHIHAQLLNLKVAGEIIAVRSFWQAFISVMETIGAGLGALGKAALSKLTGGLL